MIDAALHGWSGFALAYAAVYGPMIAGLAKSRANFYQYAISPIAALPLTAVAAVGSALFGGHGAAHVALAMGVSAWLGHAGGRALVQGAAADRVHQRGTLIAEGAPAGADKNATADRAATRDAVITLAGFAVPSQDESKHFKLIGTTGTGKSTAIQEILSKALARGDRAVIADPDGGYLRRFYNADRGDIILNPFDDRSVKWDLFAEIRNPYDVEQLARSLIPDHEGQDRSWRGYARTFFAAVAGQAHSARVSDVGELYRLLVVADAAELRTLVHATPAQPFLEEHNSRMFDSIRSVTSSAVGALNYIAQQKSARFSVRDWVNQQNPGVLFIPYKAGQIAALRSTISGWMRMAIFETMDRGETMDPGQENARLWFVVDELDALGQIDGLKDALARLRKFGGRCVLGFQSVAQVSSTYGQGEAHTIVENCANTLILRCSASEGGGTARFASQLIGEREVLRTTTSRSRRLTEMLGSISKSQHFSIEPAVLPSQLEQLPDLAGYLKLASDPAWARVRLDATKTWSAARASSGAFPATHERRREFKGAERE
ncbi:MAG TPA: type IV secretion system DNA-binding domain-containing protein [Steroidobacteraceae bacterium]